MTNETSHDPERCSEPGCERPAGVRLHIPWEDDRDVCLPHGRALVQQDGVVAVPLDDSSTEWP